MRNLSLFHIQISIDQSIEISILEQFFQLTLSPDDPVVMIIMNNKIRGRRKQMLPPPSKRFRRFHNVKQQQEDDERGEGREYISLEHQDDDDVNQSDIQKNLL